MSDKLTRFDYGRQLAERASEQGLELAQSPVVYYDRNTAGLAATLDAPLDPIVDFTAEHLKVEPGKLGSMAVCFYDKKFNEKGESEPILDCRTTGEPQAFGKNGALHFPVLAVGVKLDENGELTNLRRVNHALRHQVAHLTESTGPSFYETSTGMLVTRAIAQLVGIGAAVQVAWNFKQGNVATGAVTAAEAIGFTTCAISERAVHATVRRLSPYEWRANQISLKHREFRPITRA